MGELNPFFAPAVFNLESPVDERSAMLSLCGKYRYWLFRKWSDAPILRFVLLNPSTAGPEKDDPTVRKCIGFAKWNGFGGIGIANLFALRATDPRELVLALQAGFDCVGPEGDYHLKCIAGAGDSVVAGWGRMPYDLPAMRARLDHVRGILVGKLLCVKQSQGRPWHPLYVKYGPLVELER